MYGRRQIGGPLLEPSQTAPVKPDLLGVALKRLGPVGVLGLLALTLPPLGGFALLYWRDAVAAWLSGHGDLGLAVYIVGFVLLAGLALLPTYAQAIIGGFVFHFERGFPAALAGFVGAALLGYVVARTASGDRATRLIAEHPRWQVVYQALLRGGFLRVLGIVFLIRLPPNSPFALTNLVLAATRTSLGAYALGTLLGMAPRTAAAVYIGSTLKSLSDAQAPGWYFWAGLALSLVVLGVIGLIVSHAIQRATAAMARSGASAGK